MAIERIENKGQLLALIIRNDYVPKETNFVSDLDHSFQVGFHSAKKGHRYKAHSILPFKKIENFKPNKIYYVNEGRIGIDIYDKEEKKINYVELNPKDMIIFISGGHGVDMLEDGKFIEIKQGPYQKNRNDKKYLE